MVVVASLTAATILGVIGALLFLTFSGDPGSDSSPEPVSPAPSFSALPRASQEASPTPTTDPAFEATARPTLSPTAESSREPTVTLEPSVAATSAPSPEPSPSELASTKPAVSETPAPLISPEPLVEPTLQPTPEPTSEPTPEPTADASARPTFFPIPTGRRAIERDLTQRASFLVCEPWRPEQELAFEQAAQGAIWCGSPAPKVRQLAIYSFPDPIDLAAFWPLRLQEIGRELALLETPCAEGEAGQGDWGNGSIACYREGGFAKIRWTDERSGLYGLMDATDRDLAELYAWLRSNGRRLGIPSE